MGKERESKMDAKERKKLHRQQMKEEGKYNTHKSAGKRPGNRKKKESKKGSILSTVALILAICVFCVSAFQLFKIFSSYKKGDDEYKKVQNLAVKAEEQDGETLFSVDFDKLKEINPDTVAWIRFEEPSIISYPVVHSHDNKEYLTKLFGEGKNTYGTLFVDKDNTGDFTDRNTFIYGHRMKSGSMFGKLEEYKDESFVQEHPYFYIYTPDGKELKYEVFAVGLVTDTSQTYTKEFADDEAFLKYISHIRAESNYQTDVSVKADSQIVSLSTCTADSNEDRFVVHGVKVAER